MRIISRLLLLPSFLLIIPSCHRTIQMPISEPRASSGPGEVVPQGFIPLFNGTNLDGWMVQQVANRDLQFVDGVIDCNPHEGHGDKNLWTTKSFGDFELLVDWRIKESPYINQAAKITLPNGTYRRIIPARMY